MGDGRIIGLELKPTRTTIGKTIRKGWSQYAKARETPLRRLPSDDPKYDASFPQHPLSQVRAGLASMIASARLGAEARNIRPYRVRR